MRPSGKLLVAETRDKAVRLQRLFDLHEWKPIGFGEGLAGFPADRIVIFMPAAPIQRDIDWIEQVLSLRLVPGGRLDYFEA